MVRNTITICVDRNIQATMKNLIDQREVPFHSIKSFVDYHLRLALEKYKKE